MSKRYCTHSGWFFSSAKNTRRMKMKSFHVSLSVFLSVLLKALRMYLCVFMNCVTLLRVRFIANSVGEDSCCRGGIVNIRFGCSCERLVRPNSSTALWRFRVSTSNSPSSRSWLPIHTQLRYVDQIYAQQDIRVCEDDHIEPPLQQSKNSKALWLLRVSI